MKQKIAKITSDPRTLSPEDLKFESNVVMLVPARGPMPAELPEEEVLRQRMRRAGFKLDSGRPFVTDLPNEVGTRVALAGVDLSKGTHRLLGSARRLVRAQLEQRPARLAIACYGLGPSDAYRATEAVVAAALAAGFALPDFKSKSEKAAELREIAVFGAPAEVGYSRTRAEALGNNLARFLTALPPNELTPGLYRRRVQQIARTHGWENEFFGLKKLRTLGAGAFVAVAQGGPEPDAGILHLRYTPRKRARTSALALVGKGICFDTGGTNLKPAKYMHGMHEDMEGSAVALGALLALSELKVDFPIDCWMALAQNHIGPKAYKQNDVVKAANGTTIEVVHTDAEGRMVLADTLYLASRKKPKLIIDYATLTGACIAALSTRVSGVFTNRSDLIPLLIKAGDDSGERVWPFPIYPDYEDALKSDIADIKQCTLDNEADHILAATFLKRFIATDTNWVHVDLSAGNHKGGLAHIPTDTTGFGVRFTLNLILDQEIMG